MPNFTKTLPIELDSAMALSFIGTTLITKFLKNSTWKEAAVAGSTAAMATVIGALLHPLVNAKFDQEKDAPFFLKFAQKIVPLVLPQVISVMIHNRCTKTPYKLDQISICACLIAEVANLALLGQDCMRGHVSPDKPYASVKFL